MQRGADPGKSPAASTPRPIVTLTTDFGTQDFYVAAMKAVLIRHCPDVRLEIAVRDGSAAAELKIQVGDKIKVG